MERCGDNCGSTAAPGEANIADAKGPREQGHEPSDPLHLFANAHALPEELLLFIQPRAGGPLNASGGFITPAFSVKEAQLQLTLFGSRLHMAATRSACNAGTSQTLAPDDLNVDECRLYRHLLDRSTGGGAPVAAGNTDARSEGHDGGGGGGALSAVPSPAASGRTSEGALMAGAEGEAGTAHPDEPPLAKRARQTAASTASRVAIGHSSQAACQEVFQHLQGRWSAATANGSLVALEEFSCPRCPPPVQFLVDPSPASDTARGHPSEAHPTDEAAPGSPSTSSREEADSHAAVDPEEVVVSVSLYHPYRPKEKTHEYLALGSTPLAALCRKFYCLNNVMMSHFGVAKENEYLYVEGTFFNRSAPGSAACNLSDPVRKFCADIGVSAPPPDPSLPLPPDESPVTRQPAATGSLRARAQQTAATLRPLYPMRRTAMEGKTVRDLWLKVGASAGNLYCHQGCCEHAVEFSDVRQIHASDPRSASDYPALVYRYQPDRRRCSICRTRYAIKVTTCSDAAPEPVSFFCGECYLELHYTAGGALCPEARHNQFPYFHD